MTDRIPSGAFASQIQLAWVESFLAVVDYGGFGAAAQGLFRSQSRISSHIADLEGRLQTVLFDRSARPVALTETGRAFLPHARATVASLRDGHEAVAAVEGLVRGRIALGTYPSAGATMVPQVLRRFTEAHPGVRIELVEEAVHGLDDALASGRVGLAVRPELPEPESDITGVLLWEEPMQVVVPEGHRLATAEGPVPLATLATEPLIITGANLHHDAEAFELLAREGLFPHVAYVSDQPQNLVGLVAAGLGVGFTNLLALQTVRLDGVRALDIDAPLQRRAGVYWSTRRPLEPAARALRDLFEGSPAPEGTRALLPHRAVHRSGPTAATTTDH